MVKLQDISIYFRSDCCNKLGAAPLSKRPSKKAPIKFFEQLFNKLGNDSNSLHAVTITIGNVHYGSMSASEQYRHMKKAIKSCYRYHGETKYIFYFEYQKNGQLHAHGVIYNGYRSKFIDHFNKFGKRNTHKDSYQNVKNINYFTYIQKDNSEMQYKYPIVHNILNKDLTPAK